MQSSINNQYIPINNLAIKMPSKFKLFLLLCTFGIIVIYYFLSSTTWVNASSSYEQQVYRRSTTWVNATSSYEPQEFQVNFKNIKMAYWMDLPNERTNPACKKATKMLILVMSRRNGFDKRQALRQTWLKDAIEGTTTKFLVADPIWDGSEKEKQAILDEEQKQFRDLIFIRGIDDNYAHLHLKWLAGLHWQQAFCPQTEWIMKADDDTIVHLPRLDHWIEHKFRPKLKQNEATYFGLMISGVGPIRDPKHKWFVPKSAYPSDHYPPYMQGATYVASRQAINAVLKFTNQVDGFNMDDVLFTGILAQKANVALSDHKDIFWVGKKLREREECTDGIPNLCALWGAGSLKEFEQIYSDMKSIKCQN